MIRSMTAFSRLERHTAAGVLAWELRSVNHRYLEVSLRLPEELRNLETAVRERIGAAVKRGKVDGQLRFQPADAAAGDFALNMELVGRLVQASARIDGLLTEPAPIGALDVLRWPGVLRATEPDRDQLARDTLNLLDDTLAELVTCRGREGAKLKFMIDERAGAILAQAAHVKQRLPGINARLREKLLTRLAEVRAQADPQRLEQELVFLAQRLDVEEELDRLAAHVDEVRRVLDQDEPVGRRLDFLMQELNREANTLGSKSADVETTRASVEMKVLIEQMREQVQNIE